MWQYPNMLPKLYTWGPVVKKLIDGAGKKIK
jgi:translation initiation factor 2D